jgi:hypothetical protein
MIIGSTMIATVVIVAGIIVGIIAIKDPDLLYRLFVENNQTSLFIRGVTICLIISAVFILRCLDRVTSEAAIATIGSIAGYVLGKSGPSFPRRRRGQEAERTPGEAEAP